MKYYEDCTSRSTCGPGTSGPLRELLISTEGKTDAEKEAQKKKADGLLQRIHGGDDFGELAKRFSDGSTAKQGGDLGTFERGQLAANLADVVFKLNKASVTDVMPTQTGYLILQVQEHLSSGATAGRKGGRRRS